MSGYLRWLVAQARGQGSGVRPVRHPISLAHGIQGEMRAPTDHAEAASFYTAPGQFEQLSGMPPRYQAVMPAEADTAIPAAPRLARNPVPAEVQPVTPGDDIAGRPIMTGADWYEYTTVHFTGWPTEQNFYIQGSPNPYPSRTMVMVRLKPVK